MTPVEASQIANGSVSNSSYEKLANNTYHIESTFSQVLGDIGDLTDVTSVLDERVQLLEAGADNVLTSVTVTRSDGITTLKSGTGVSPHTTCFGAFSVRDQADTLYHLTVGSTETNFYNQGIKIHGGSLDFRESGESKYSIQNVSGEYEIVSSALLYNYRVPSRIVYTNSTDVLPTILLPVGTILSYTINFNLSDNATVTVNMLPGTGKVPFGVWSVQVRAAYSKSGATLMNPTYLLHTINSTGGTVDDYFAVAQSGEAQTGNQVAMTTTMMSHCRSGSGEIVLRMTSNIDVTATGTPQQNVTMSTSFLKVA